MPTYLTSVVLNVLPAAVLWLIDWKTQLLHNRIVAVLTLIAILSLAFLTRSYLLAALAGLLLRPIPEKMLQQVVSVFYYTSGSDDTRLNIVVYDVLCPRTAVWPCADKITDRLFPQSARAVA